MKIRAQKVTLADDTGLAWFFAFGDSDFKYQGRVVEMSSQFEAAAESIQLQLASAFQPRMIEEHARNGGGIGTVKRTRVLTRDEAEALGVPQKQDRALYLGVELTEVGRRKYDAGAIEYTSVGMTLGFEHPETGEVWAGWLKELSAVAVPHLTSQPPASTMQGLQLADGAPPVPPAQPDPAQAPEPTLASIAEQLNKLLQLLTPAQPPASPETQMADSTKGGVTLTLADVQAENASLKQNLLLADTRIAALEKNLKATQASQAVDALGAIVPADKRQVLIDLHLSDDSEGKTSFASFVGLLADAAKAGAPPAKSKRTAGSGPDSKGTELQLGDVDDEREIVSRAMALKREKNCSYTMAVQMVRNGEAN